jgi:aminoglycoside phosphotransferase (APT) family kinase protein
LLELESLKWLAANREIVATEEPVILHNDFHPLNLMLADDGEIYVLDWPDAALGDRHHDVARTLALFWLAPPLARARRAAAAYGDQGLRDQAIRGALRTELPLERPRLRYREALHAAMAWAQVAAIHGGMGRARSEVRGREQACGFERSLQAYF